MTSYFYPKSGMGVPSAQTNVMNKLAAANNKTAGTSSWNLPASSSFPTLKGATGNTLYPAPKTYPSVSSYPVAKPAAATSYPSVSGYLGKLTTGGSSTPSSPSYPSLSMPNRQPGGIAGGPGQTSSGLPIFSQQSLQAAGFKMPAGFSSGALGGGSSAPAPQAQQMPPSAAPARTPTSSAAPVSRPGVTPAPGQGYGMSAPSAQTSAVNKLAQQNNQQNALMQKYGGPPKGPGVYPTKEEAAYHAGAWNPDSSYGKADLTYGVNGGSEGGFRVGPDPRPVQQRPTQPAPPVIVGRPTQTSQPVSIPVNRQPTQDEIDEANQGAWLS